MDTNTAENSTTEGVRVTTPKWKPTLQQKEILEYTYRNGMRSPTVEDIEKITLVLKNYGRVEGKNVFYWFQNFNARERELRKRALQSSHSLTGEEAPRGTTLSLQTLARIMPSSDIRIGDQLERQRGAVVQEDSHVSKESGNNSQTSDGTLELFPLKPDGGGLGRSLNTRFAD